MDEVHIDDSFVFWSMRGRVLNNLENGLSRNYVDFKIRQIKRIHIASARKQLQDMLFGKQVVLASGEMTNPEIDSVLWSARWVLYCYLNHVKFLEWLAPQLPSNDHYWDDK